VQRKVENRAGLHFDPGLQGATAHGQTDDDAFAGNILAEKRYGETYLHALVLAPIFVDPYVAHTPFTLSETLAAKLALEGIDIEVTQQNFEKPGARNAPDKFPSAVRTFQLSHSMPLICTVVEVQTVSEAARFHDSVTR
jgi:hypothetical protein